MRSELIVVICDVKYQDGDVLLYKESWGCVVGGRFNPEWKEQGEEIEHPGWLPGGGGSET